MTDKILNKSGLEWLNINSERGCNRVDLYERLIKRGFLQHSIRQTMDFFAPNTEEYQHSIYS